MNRHVAQRNVLYNKVVTPDKLVRQLGPSCEVHAYFHYIFTDPNKLYRYLTMDGWNKMLDQMLKYEEQSCIDLTDNLDYFFHDVKWEKESIYSIDNRALKVFDMYPMLGDKSGVINMFYFNGKEGQDVYLEFFRRLRKGSVFQNNSILDIRGIYEQMGVAALNATKDKKVIFDESYMDRVEEEMKKEGYEFDDAIQGHSTTFTRGYIIDSNGVVFKVPTDLVYSSDTVISCYRVHCQPLKEIDETPPEMEFMDRIYENMVRALSNEVFTKGMVRDIITGEMDRVKSRVSEDTEPIPMQPLE